MQRHPRGPYHAHPHPFSSCLRPHDGDHARRPRRLLHLHHQHRFDQHHSRNHLRRQRHPRRDAKSVQPLQSRHRSDQHHRRRPGLRLHRRRPARGQHQHRLRQPHLHRSQRHTRRRTRRSHHSHQPHRNQPRPHLQQRRLSRRCLRSKRSRRHHSIRHRQLQPYTQRRAGALLLAAPRNRHPGLRHRGGLQIIPTVSEKPAPARHHKQRQPAPLGNRLPFSLAFTLRASNEAPVRYYRWGGGFGVTEIGFGTSGG